MSKNIKATVTVLIKSVVLAVMVFIINFSLMTILVSATKPSDGYTVYKTENGKQTEVYTHYYKDGEDKNLEKYKSLDGYSKKALPGTLSQNYKDAINIFTCVAALCLIIAGFYTPFWKMGDDDANKNQLMNAPYNRNRAWYISIIGTSPYILSWLILLVCKIAGIGNSYFQYYRILNYHYYYLIDWFLPNNTFTNNSIIGVLALVITLVPVVAVSVGAYRMGEKHIDIKNRIMYKKKEDK
ncbi:MAG: hypothetical protein KBS41_04030 [Oscillospiraceae bacterium]|nr:hypothetical protein [Candidatus Equicaccousia limihippi]